MSNENVFQQAKQQILSGASAGTSTGYLPLGAYGERFMYQLDSGTVSTGFSVDVSADGVTSLAQVFTGTYASSTTPEITPPLYISNPQAKFIRWTITSGGPISIYRKV
jgi:hypothetical protein